MALRTRPNPAEARHSASGPITLILQQQPANIIRGELKDVSPSGLRVRLECAAFESGQLAAIRYAREEKKVRIIWVRELAGKIESGLLLQEAYLVQRVLAGDSQAFSELISPYMHGLHCTVSSILHNHADVEEVVQETLFKAALHLDQFHRGENFRPWLAQIAMHEAFKHLRKNRRHCHDLFDLDDENNHRQELHARFIDPRESPAEALERREFVEAVCTALRSLDEMYRQVFVLHELWNLSMQEAASLLGIKVDTANTRLHRARLLMRKALLQRYPHAMRPVNKPRHH